jgi:hypothetical protein
MKKFDYFCILYCVALLIFGFNDDAPEQKRVAGSINSTTKAERSVAARNPNESRRHSQYASMVPVSGKPPVQMRASVAMK